MKEDVFKIIVISVDGKIDAKIEDFLTQTKLDIPSKAMRNSDITSPVGMINVFIKKLIPKYRQMMKK